MTILSIGDLWLRFLNALGVNNRNAAAWLHAVIRWFGYRTDDTGLEATINYLWNRAVQTANQTMVTIECLANSDDQPVEIYINLTAVGKRGLIFISSNDESLRQKFDRARLPKEPYSFTIPQTETQQGSPVVEIPKKKWSFTTVVLLTLLVAVVLAAAIILL